MITDEIKDSLKARDITLHASNASVNFIFPSSEKMIVESPVEFRAGRFDINEIGAFTYLGGEATLMRHINKIGRYCSIASNTVTGLVEHETDSISAHPLFHGNWLQWSSLSDFYAKNTEELETSRKKWLKKASQEFSKINIGNNVWIGEGCLIRRGVSIGDGAIIASRSVITKDVEPYSIVGGTPTKHIRYRYSGKVLELMKTIPWWEYELDLLAGIDFDDMVATAPILYERIHSNEYKKFTPKRTEILKSNNQLLLKVD